MSEIFKTKIESSQTQEITPQPLKPLESEDVPGNALKAKEEENNEDKTLDIWEGLNRRSYGEDYFNIRELINTEHIKDQFPYIDNFIKSELKERDLAQTTDNYEELLREIESEIGTSKTETYTRLKKVYNYIKTLIKYREVKAKKDAFLKII